MSKIVIVPITHGTEELEAITIIDLLRRAGISVKVVSNKEIVTCSRGIKIIPDILFEAFDIDMEFDAIIIPGGTDGVRELSNLDEVSLLLKKAQKDGKLIGAICAGPLVLDSNKLLDNNTKLTSHPSVKYALENYNYKEKEVVEFNNIITSRAVGTAIPFTLRIIAYLLGEETSDRIAKEILYFSQSESSHNINE